MSVALKSLEPRRLYSAGAAVGVGTISGVTLSQDEMLARSVAIGRPWLTAGTSMTRSFGAVLRAPMTGAAIRNALVRPGTPGSWMDFEIPASLIPAGLSYAQLAAATGKVPEGAAAAAGGLQSAVGGLLSGVGGVAEGVGGVASGVGAGMRWLPVLAIAGGMAVAGVIIAGAVRKGKKR